MALITTFANIEASCAICGSQQYPECPHESERLQIAVNQAMARWAGIQRARDWVLHHARKEISTTFKELKTARYEAHLAYLRTLPCYTLYEKYAGNPPLSPPALQTLHTQIAHAQSMYQSGIDEDWRRSCLRYPEVLDYFFEMVGVELPGEEERGVLEPRFGVPVGGGGAGAGAVGGGRKMIKARRASRSRGSVEGDVGVGGGGRRKRERRRYSRGRTPVRRG